MSIQRWQCIVEKSPPSSLGGPILTRRVAQWQYIAWEAIKAHYPESSPWKCYLIRPMLYAEVNKVSMCHFVRLIRVLGTKPFNSHIMNRSLMENALSKHWTKTMRGGLKERRFEKNRIQCTHHEGNPSLRSHISIQEHGHWAVSSYLEYSNTTNPT